MSRTTVSLVLNGVEGSGISEATRQRVLSAARELAYVPDAAARTLASGRTRTLGLVICHAEHLQVDAFIPQALYSLDQTSRAEGFRVLVEALEDVTRPEAYQELVRAKQIDGLVVLNPRRDDLQLPRLIADGFPVVVIGRYDHPDASTVDVDNVAAARGACEHLIGLGRRRLAHVAYGPEVYASVRARLRGFREALERAGLPFDPHRTTHADFSAESGERATRELLERPGALPDALLCGNDVVAFGAMTALRERGLVVPDDVAVVGFDDIPLARHAVPPLTTVRLPAVAMGEAAARLLLRRIRGETSGDERVLLDAPLVVRASCGAG